MYTYYTENTHESCTMEISPEALRIFGHLAGAYPVAWYPVAISAGSIPDWRVPQKRDKCIDVCLKKRYNVRVHTESAHCCTSWLTIKTQMDTDTVKRRYCAYIIYTQQYLRIAYAHSLTYI